MQVFQRPDNCTEPCRRESVAMHVISLQRLWSPRYVPYTGVTGVTGVMGDVVVSAGHGRGPQVFCGWITPYGFADRRRVVLDSTHRA